MTNGSADPVPSSGLRMKAAFFIALAADIVQMVVFPLFIEGAGSPADDVVDLGVGVVLTSLLGFHWEFLPSFLGKLVPGVDLVPLWTLAVASVYRKRKTIAAGKERQARIVEGTAAGLEIHNPQKP